MVFLNSISNGAEAYILFQDDGDFIQVSKEIFEKYAGKDSSVIKINRSSLLIGGNFVGSARVQTSAALVADYLENYFVKEHFIRINREAALKIAHFIKEGSTIHYDI